MELIERGWLISWVYVVHLRLREHPSCIVDGNRCSGVRCPSSRGRWEPAPRTSHQSSTLTRSQRDVRPEKSASWAEVFQERLRYERQRHAFNIWLARPAARPWQLSHHCSRTYRIVPRFASSRREIVAGFARALCGTISGVAGPHPGTA